MINTHYCFVLWRLLCLPKEHFRLSNAVIESAGGVCLYSWLVELQMAFMDIPMPGSYRWVKNSNLWSELEMEVEIQCLYCPMESLDLFFLGKRALRSTCGSSSLVGIKFCLILGCIDSNSITKKKFFLHSLCDRAMLSTRDTQII